MNREAFLSVYGPAALLKLYELKEYLESKSIDIRKLNNEQISIMLGIDLVLSG